MQKTILLNSGSEHLSKQFASIIPPIQITKFRVGTGSGSSIDRTVTTVEGDLLFEGDATLIGYTPMHSDEIVLRFTVPRTEEAEIIPGNIVIFADDDVALFQAKDMHGLTAKYPMEVNKVGSQLVYQLLLNIPGLMTRFDFTNLEPVAATFANFATDDTLTRWPWQEPADQMFIEQDSRTGRPAFVVSHNRIYWANPDAQDYDGDFIY